MRFILSISSDIGTAIAIDWLNGNEIVAGTYRTWSDNCELLRKKGAHLIQCDLSDDLSMTNAVNECNKLDSWEVLLLAPGDQNPIGLFNVINFCEWRQSIEINFLKPVEFMHRVLHLRQDSSQGLPSVLMFAGGGTNSATSHYSAYTVAKIASIKLIELLDYEIPDCKFSIIGPGWVESKIHDATIKAGLRAGKNYEKTLSMRRDNLMSPIENVIEACNWVINKPKTVTGGRNFSAVFDTLSSNELESMLIRNIDFFKLRRYGNGIYER